MFQVFGVVDDVIVGTSEDHLAAQWGRTTQKGVFLLGVGRDLPDVQRHRVLAFSRHMHRGIVAVGR